MAGTKPRRRARTLAIVVAATLFGLWAIYVIAANVVLRTKWARDELDADPASLELDWQRATTWWPGRLRVHGLRVRIRDSGREMEIRADDVRARLDWISLLVRRQLHLRDVAIHGAEVRYRGRRTPRQLLREKDLDALPPIAGLDPIPVRIEPESGWLPDELYDLVGVSLDDLHADAVREIWIDQYRFRGDAQVQGTFHLQPQRWLELRDASLDVGFGRVTLGDLPMIERLEGRVELTIDPYDPRFTRGDALAEKFHAHVALDGGLGDARFVEHWLVGPDAPRVRGGGGALRGDVRVERGRVDAGTRVRVQVREVAITTGAWTLGAAARVSLDVKADRGAPLAELELDLEDARGVVGGDERTKLVAALVGVRAHARELALTRAFTDAEASLDLPDVRAPAALLARALREPLERRHVTIERGELAGRARVDVSFVAKVARADVGLRANGARVRVGDRVFEGDLDARLAIPHAWERAIDLDGTFVAVHDAQVVGEGGGGWFARIEAPRARVQSGEEGTTVEADLEGRARDARPIAPLVTAAAGAPSWLRDVVRLPDLRGTAKLAVGPGGVDVRAIRVTSNTSSILARVQLPKQGKTRAAVLLKVGASAAGLEVGDGHVRLVLTDAENWYRREAGAADTELREMPRGGGRK